ncbi:Serine/threonine-protein kinase SRPK [Tolypocladium ophioglossoides CBS 100239]|uniref:non-specific serine/threonine protein kinase n=1 Tax=Tolypocladium ophioglossoides (strain CBS 100239) TaxID=1163406 RepID=A0A0L0N1X6_TOLOC|nr:Serine/threonine-protein kinase SRPK [Tolypocladium ophioglossoides CBS 100239]
MAFSILSSGAFRLKSLFRRPSKQLHSLSTISEETMTRYCKGGYHPVRIGDLFNHDKYKIVSKLGYGAYSTVWLAFDLESKQHVALKILTADSFGQGNDTFELDILKHIRGQNTSKPGANPILGLLDEFEHRGPNGNHVCLVFKAMGPDMSKYRRLFPKLKIPLPLMRDISKQLLLALSYLHDTCRVIHTDIKPQNILVETSAINKMFQQAPSEAFQPDDSPLDPPNDFYVESIQVSSAEEDVAWSTDLSVRLADFGTASWIDKHLTEWIQPQMLRAPEVILGAGWDCKVDIWNLGLIIWELAEGRLIFDGMWTSNDQYTPEAHLAQITAVFGSIPRRLLDRSKNRDRYFDADGRLLEPSTFPPCALEQLSKNTDLSGSEREEFLRFIGSIVRPDPEDRPDARELLQSPWLAR